MSRKIGEALIEKGVLTPDKLHRALRAQLMLGGHLGTNLIELGLIEEACLGQTLAEIFKVRYAARSFLENVPAEVLAAMSREMAEAYRAIPIGREGNTLHVAAVDPRGLARLSVRTGYRVVPYVSPEIRIVEAMDRYYGVAQPVRYLKLSHALGPVAPAPRRDLQAPAELAGSGGRKTVFHKRPPDDAGTAAPLRLGIDPSAALDLPAAARPGEAAARAPWPAGADDGGSKELGASPLVGRRGQSPTDGIALLIHRLASSDSAEAVGEAVLAFVGRTMSRRILFGIDGDQARPFVWRGIPAPAETLIAAELVVSPESLFGVAIDQPFYRGPVPEDAGARGFFRAVGLDVPEEVFLMPIYLDDRLEAFLYGDPGPHGRVAGSEERYLVLREKLALAMKMIAYREKLLEKTPSEAGCLESGPAGWDPGPDTPAA